MQSPARPPDEAALQLLARGDRRGAIALLMRAHGGDLFRFCAEQLGDAQAAEDLLQTVFIQAFQALEGYEPRSTLRAFLFGIARHRCQDAARSRRRWLRLLLPEGDGLPEQQDPRPGGEEMLMNARLTAALEECLAQLTPKVRETLSLRFRAGLGYDELAHACGEQVGTLRVRVARALPLLRTCLDGKGLLP